MADEADRADAHSTVLVAASLTRIQATIPLGEQGECEECGEPMPRLVDGRCGFCRDGRRPPLSTYDRLAPVVTCEKETIIMPTAKASEHAQTIAVPAKGRVVHLIRERADERDLPLGRAAASLIEDLIAHIDADEAGLTKLLAEYSSEDLLAELGRRLIGGASPKLIDALARADAAEAQLAKIAAVFEGSEAA